MYLAIDEGTTNVKEVLFDDDFNPVELRKKGISTYFPREGWVEQAPEEIWNTVRALLGTFDSNIDAVGITNQRETTVLWSAETGKAVHNAIVWSCRRTAEFVKELERAHGAEIKNRTGLEMDAYFSASKIRWLIDNVPGLAELERAGKLRFGTIDSYLLWKLTNGKEHVTEHTNASRTMLYNLRDGYWDYELLDLFGISESMLPEIKNSADEFGVLKMHGREIPITGMIGDQQSALLAHGCQERGETKITYGTGTFILTSTGTDIIMEKGLLSTVAWGLDGRREFALEGSILSSGTVVEWLKSMGLWTEEVGEDSSVYFVPAFFGLGSPYWDPYARGALMGITAYTDRRHITRAALESIGYMVRDILEIIKKHVPLPHLKVDGGMTNNRFLMQFQADISGIDVLVPEFEELTALGAAMVAAIGAGRADMSELKDTVKYEHRYFPEKSELWRAKKYEKWHDAVRRSMGWAGATWEN